MEIAKRIIKEVLMDRRGIEKDLKKQSNQTRNYSVYGEKETLKGYGLAYCKLISSFSADEAAFSSKKYAYKFKCFASVPQIESHFNICLNMYSSMTKKEIHTICRQFFLTFFWPMSLLMLLLLVVVAYIQLHTSDTHKIQLH